MISSRASLTLIAAFLVHLAAPHAAAQSIPTTGQPVAGLEAFDTAVMQLMTKYRIPGAALAVVHDGKFVLARGYGYAEQESGTLVQLDSLFRIASVSKPITAAAILKLVEEGKLNLSDRAFQILRSLQPPAGAQMDARLQDITILHLLEHKGGWDRDGTGYDPMFDVVRAAQAVGVLPPGNCEVVLRYMLGRSLDFTPGSRYSYSNFGYCVLGRVIEQVTGISYESYVKTHILDPIGADRIRLAKSLLSQRFPGEVRYYDYPGASLASSVFPPYPLVPWPYGGFFMDAHNANGGWISSTIDLLRYLTSMNGSRKPAILSSPPPGFVGYVPPVGPGWGWLFNGSLPGTMTSLRLNGTTAWSLLTNTRNLPDAFFPESDATLVQVAQAVTSWPIKDLFQADLVVSSLRAPVSGTIGDKISSMEVQIRNDGASSAGPFRIGFYFSADPVIATGDVDSGWYCGFDQGLAAGGSTGCGGDIGVPASLSPGTYYLGAIVDDLNQVGEANENNNSRVADTGPITIGGDPNTPRILDGGIVNGASFRGPAVTPGSIASIFGSSLTRWAGIVNATGVPLPTELQGISVSVNGRLAPLFAAANVNGQEQINLQIPWEITGQPTATIRVGNNGVSSGPVELNILPTHPGIFTVDGTVGAILHGTTNLPVTSAGPAANGEIVVLYATGLGSVTNPPRTGSPASSSPLSVTTLLPVVTIGGINASVVYSGLAPGFVGLYQVNVRVPPGAPTGSVVPVVLTAGGVASNSVTIAIR